MASSSLWLMRIDQWEATAASTVKASHAAFIHEKYALQLHVETSPVPFRPSTVLSQLIQSEQHRGGSTKPPRYRAKNAEYLERKLESEVQQHYEVESGQTCAKWKKLHTHFVDDRRQLQASIDWDAAHLSGPLNIQLTEDDDSSVVGTTTQRERYEEDDEASEAANQRQLVEREWIHQERFNIQEAFTNQSKKIQADHQAFMDQLDADYIAERHRILSQSTSSQGARTVTKITTSPLDRQFKSNAKRHMLVQTAPVMNLGHSDPSRVFAATTTSKSDLTPHDSQLQDLEHRLASFQKAAADRLKDGMQWIARQCAHMFSQLDCREAEATLVLMLTRQNEDEATKLLRHVRRIASQLRHAVQDHSGRPLPPLPTLPTVRLAPTSSKASERPPRRRSEPVGFKGAQIRHA